MIISIIISIIIGILLNRVRGSGNKPIFLPNKISVYLLWTAILGALLVWNNGATLLTGVYALGIFPFLLLCFSFGWGKYFPHGGPINNNEVEFAPADLLANLFIGKPNNLWYPEQNKSWKTVAMSARFGLTFGILLFPYLAYISNSFWPLIGVIGSWLCGLLYKVAFIKHTDNSLPNAEYYVGAWLGFLISTIFW